MTWTILGAPHEPSAWLRPRLDGIYKQVHPLLAIHHTSVVRPLTTGVRPGTRADRECDRCRMFVPIGAVLWLFALNAVDPAHNSLLVVTGGLCGECATREFPQHIGLMEVTR